MYKNLLKRPLDILMSLSALLLLLPIFFIITIFLFFSNKGKPFFLQMRPGKKGESFTIIKFKTMNDEKDTEGNLLPDKERMTTIGYFIRKTSLDEIPQLINVVKGDMSLIGPRPLLPEYLSLYNAYQKRRHEVRPGITGWAQVNGRNALSWKQKFEHDIIYVDNHSFFFDLKILARTFKKVMISEGISTDGEATTTAFKGNK